ncbi:MAG TPA: arginine--tRNA ligase, partial [Rubricoccaceae bacterium]
AAFRDALGRLPDLPEGFDPSAVAVEFQTPANPDHGDLATNVALQLAKPLRRAPRAVAEALVAALDIDPARVAAVEIAGPGFVNVRFAAGYLAAGLADLLAAGDAYGRTDTHAGETAIVEYVSANPTGPLTVGHGRNAVLGDTIANLLDWTGYRVTREYYFNDAGRQMRVLGQSVRARYAALVRPETATRVLDDGETVPEGFPDGGYLGGYITEIARALADAHGDALLDAPDETPFTAAAKTAIFAEIDATLKRLGVVMDEQFNEHDLYTSNAVWDVVEQLKARDLAYEKDGATWFKTSALGKTTTDAEGDRGVDVVLVKSTGEPTYRLPDIAYHIQKLGRGYDLVLDVFGADHIATYPDVLRGVAALGGDADKIDVLVYQFVTLVRGGQPVKMSTRKANYVTLDELMDEVGEDVTRFFFLMRSANTHLEFDLDLAKEASEKNPVFYLQYAHARICSIAAKAAETGLPDVRGADGSGADLALLTHASEVALVKTLLLFPGEVRMAAEGRAPHRLAGFLREVAVAFSQFYRDCRIVGEPAEIAAARLHLAEATRRTLAHGLAVLGVSAPERMDREEAAA